MKRIKIRQISTADVQRVTRSSFRVIWLKENTTGFYIHLVKDLNDLGLLLRLGMYFQTVRFFGNSIQHLLRNEVITPTNFIKARLNLQKIIKNGEFFAKVHHKMGTKASFRRGYLSENRTVGPRPATSHLAAPGWIPSAPPVKGLVDPKLAQIGNGDKSLVFILFLASSISLTRALFAFQANRRK